MNKFQKQLQTRHSKVKSNKKRIAYILTDWAQSEYRTKNDLYGGIGYYRVVKPAQALRKWFEVDVIGADILKWGTQDETYTRLGRDYDLIISKHIMDGQTASNILAAAKHFKRKVIVDIDDNYFDIRKDNPALKDYDTDKAGRYYLGAFLELADGMIVSTEPLKKVYEKLNKNIDVLPNCNDVNDWPTTVKRQDGIIRIGYAGGTAHDEDLDLVTDAMGMVLSKYQNARFEVIGALSPEKAKEMGSKMLKFGNHRLLERFGIMGGTQAWEGYPKLLAGTGWDIGLCPLRDDEFAKCRSHIKFMEYTMAGAAVIASPVYPYIEPIEGVAIIQDGITGLLAEDNEWFEKLEQLIKDEFLRKQMARNAYTFIKSRWQYAQWATKYKAIIEKYL